MTDRSVHRAQGRRRAIASIVGLVLFASALPSSVGVAVAAGSPVTALVIDSDPGNWIGQGQQQTLLSPERTFTSDYHNAEFVRVWISDEIGSWSLAFGSPIGSPIVPGTTYETATPGSVERGFAELSAPGRGCSGQTGHVTVHEYAFDAGSNTLTNLALKFALDCSGTTTYGELRWASDIPWATAPVSPASLAFGMDPIGGSAVSRTLTVTSGGSGPLHVTAASVVGSGASDFTVTDDTCTAVAVATGSTCDITVAYNASNLSLPSVALVIDSDAARASRSIPIQASPTFSWSSDPGSVDFGTVPALSNATRTVTLTYLGDGSLTVTGFEFQATNLGVPPDFSVAAETCTATPIANGASCTIDVRFKPEAIGQEEGVLTMLGSSPIDVGGSSVAVIRGRGGYYVPSSAWNAPTVVTPSYTWNEGGALDRSSYTTSSYLHVLSMTDRVGSKWVTNSGPRMGVLYSRSSNGTTWSTARRLNSALTHGYWGTLTANYKYVDVAWVQSAKVYGVSGTAPRVLYFRHNGNHGSSTSWGAAKRITSTTGRIDHPSITSSGSRILLAWTDSSTGAIRMALSKDRGATFSISTVGTTARYTSLGKSGHPVVTLDGTTAIVAWLSSSSGAIRSRISTTSGSTWGTTSTVSNASIGVPTVAAGSGRAAVAFEYGDAFVRVWKSGWKPTIVLQPNEGTNYSFFYAPAIGFNGSKLGAAWSGCLNDGSSDCSNLSESTATHLLWAESPDDGAHWSQGAIVGSAYVSGARHLNDVPSINWSTKRYLVWNGSTIDTNYYRIFAAAGATIATAAALTPAVTVPTVSVQSDPPAGVSSLGCEPLPAIAPLVESLGRPEADRAGC